MARKAFTKAKELHDALEADVRSASAALNAFPKGARGLTPDAVKCGPEYAAAKGAFDMSFGMFRNFNAWFATAFANELRAERAARRAA